MHCSTKAALELDAGGVAHEHVVQRQDEDHQQRHGCGERGPQVQAVRAVRAEVGQPWHTAALRGAERGGLAEEDLQCTLGESAMCSGCACCPRGSRAGTAHYGRVRR